MKEYHFWSWMLVSHIILKKDITFSFLISTLSLVTQNYRERSNRISNLSSTRREYITKSLITFTFSNKVSAASLQNFKYSSEWTGTALPLLSPTEAASVSKSSYEMARWPDPILRRPASRITSLQNVHSIATKLRNTARENQAVGLAAQQCGIDLSMIFLDDSKSGGLFLLNPRITARSSEYEMQIWNEKCLVLPPSFTATVLRDAIVQVQYETLEGITTTRVLKGEMARALQHELDHDRGILILDHVSLEELKEESLVMMEIEEDGHELRQALAYDRFIDFDIALVPSSRNSLWDAVKDCITPVANAAEDVKKESTESKQAAECDQECQKRRKIIQDRRAMMKQSRSTGRTEVFELSKQRAALYGTRYRGMSCPPNVPCI